MARVLTRGRGLHLTVYLSMDRCNASLKRGRKPLIGQEYLPAYRQAGENLIKRMI